MSDNTLDPAATRTAASINAAADRRTEEPRRTTAELLARSIHSRLKAAARQSVAEGLARAGADEFTRIAVAAFPHGYPDCSEWGALCPERDLSKEQAEAIYQDARRAVQAEANHMTASAPPEMAKAIALVLAEWQAAAAKCWAEQCRLREEMDQEDAEEEAEARAEEKEKMAAGREYVRTYLLQDVEEKADESWIAESLASGWLALCPRCHFLHLPVLPFAPHPFQIRRRGRPVDACDVCAFLPELQDPINWPGEWEKSLPDAEALLAAERTQRAVTLYQFWIEASNGAEALRVAVIAERLHGLLRMARTPGAGES